MSNVTKDYPVTPHNAATMDVFFFLHTIVALWIICSNSLLFIAMTKNKYTYSTIDHLFIRTLAVTDVTTGLIYIVTLWIAKFDNSFRNDAYFCSIRALIMSGFLIASVLQVMMLTVIKLVYIKYPMTYPSYITNTTLVIMFICLIMFSFSVLLTFFDTQLDSWILHCFTVYNLMFSTFTFAYVNITAAIITMTSLHFYLLQVSRTHIQKICQTNQKQGAKLMKDAKATKAFTAITVAMVCLYTPNVMTYYTITFWNIPVLGVTLTVWKTTLALMILASTVNVSIHCYHNKRLRRAMLRAMTCNQFGNPTVESYENSRN